MKSILGVLASLLAFSLQAQSLRDTQNVVDILIISYADQAETMGLYKQWRESQGYAVKIVSTTDVYHEFEAEQQYKSIKAFIDYAFESWHKPPSYIILVGGYSKVPSYPVERYVMGQLEAALTDNCYVLDELVPNRLHVPIGRIPTETPEQLMNVLHKTIYVEDQTYRDAYGLDFLFLADNCGGNCHGGPFEETTALLIEQLPEGQKWARVDVDSVSEFYGTRQDFLNALNQSPLVLNFSGFGAEYIWTHEKMLTFQDVDSVNNTNAPFLMLPLTCCALVAESPDSVLVNRFLWEADKGAFAAIAPSQKQYASDIMRFAKRFYEELLRQRPAQLGDVFVAAMNTLPFQGYSDWLLNFTVIGDPVLTLPIRFVAESHFQKDQLPMAFELKQNYPNPFNPTTTIEFSLPSYQVVNLTVYNLLGQPVATLFDHQLMPAGRHSILFEAGDMPSGSYLYSIEAGELRVARRMVILK